MYNEALNVMEEDVNYEIGKLVHGNANPSSDDYNSVSDFYIGENYLEIRIPWGLLNFMDPSTKQIQDDFYEIFKTKPLMINDIKVGLTIRDDNSTSRLSSRQYKLNSWILPTYHERLKESYYIVKNELLRK